MEAVCRAGRDTHIDAIRGEFNISLDAVFRYNRENRDEVQNIKNIFHLNGGNREKVMVLLFLFSAGEDERDAVIRKYCRQTGLSGAEHNPGGSTTGLIGPLIDPLIDKYKLMLVTALIYNPDFYAMAWNFREALNAGLDAGQTDEDSFPEPAKSNIVPFKAPRRSSRKISPLMIAAAAGIAVVFFFAVLFRFSSGGMGERINNTWVASLKEPEKNPDGVTYVSAAEEGARIELLSPLVGMAMEAADNAGTEAAIDYYTKAIRRERNNAAFYVNRGIARAVNGYLDSAIRDFDKAIELDPENTAAYYNRAVARAGKGNARAAAAGFNEVIAVNPGDRDALYAIGALYYRQYESNETRPAVLLDNAIDAFRQIEGYKDSDVVLDYLLKLRN
jgi:tetratricopeptide (TPR) repeat protein